ncbi:hypothetical protein C4B68_02475 [Streptomyces dengpaensis]|uniref:PE-PGRS family protein n=2 Tax=Streptomyces TaxID=1883 RepID=A0ABM6SKC5_9ACTN|nr:hypothetical protein C4B68_02475 [Streptomyces dengpaensis]PIB03299.1 hypothetical protein B1C81_37605 [Streptomyces sp. HG99]
MRGFEWDSEEAVAYEAAIEAVNGVVGAYSARIAAEEARPEPDAQAIAAAIAGRREVQRLRESLDPADHAAIARTRREMTELARQIREVRR